MVRSVLFPVEGKVYNGLEIGALLHFLAGCHYVYVLVPRLCEFIEDSPEERARRAKMPFGICGITFHSYGEAKRVFDRFEAECAQRFFGNEEAVGKVLKEIMEDSI